MESMTRISNKFISITFKEKKGKKKLDFEFKTEDSCSEILAKINYLLVSSIDPNNPRKRNKQRTE